MKKNILFIIYTFSDGGGTEKLLRDIVNGLDYEKYSVDIIEVIHENGDIEEINEEVEFKGAILKGGTGIKYKLKRKILHYLIQNFPDFIRREYIHKQYDIEIAFNSRFPSYLIKGKKNIVWIDGIIDVLDYQKINSKMEKLETYLEYKVQKNTLEKADKIINISKESKKSLIRLFPTVKDKSQIIYNGLKLNDIKKLAMETKIENNVFTIVSVGRLDTNKNQILLIEVADLLKKSGLEFKIQLIGDGDQEDFLKGKVKEYNLVNNVEFLGYVSNPYPYIKAATVLCVTSLTEGFGNVIIEAMTLKTCVISTKTGVAKELDCIITFDYNKESLYEKILFVIKNREKVINKVEEAEKVSQQFMLEKYIKSIEEVLDNI